MSKPKTITMWDVLRSYTIQVLCVSYKRNRWTKEKHPVTPTIDVVYVCLMSTPQRARVHVQDLLFLETTTWVYFQNKVFVMSFWSASTVSSSSVKLRDHSITTRKSWISFVTAKQQNTFSLYDTSLDGSVVRRVWGWIQYDVNWFQKKYLHYDSQQQQSRTHCSISEHVHKRLQKNASYITGVTSLTRESQFQS